MRRERKRNGSENDWMEQKEEWRERC